MGEEKRRVVLSHVAAQCRRADRLGDHHPQEKNLPGTLLLKGAQIRQHDPPQIRPSGKKMEHHNRLDDPAQTQAGLGERERGAPSVHIGQDKGGLTGYFDRTVSRSGIG